MGEVYGGKRGRVMVGKKWECFVGGKVGLWMVKMWRVMGGKRGKLRVGKGEGYVLGK